MRPEFPSQRMWSDSELIQDKTERASPDGFQLAAVLLGPVLAPNLQVSDYKAGTQTSGATVIWRLKFKLTPCANGQSPCSVAGQWRVPRAPGHPEVFGTSEVGRSALILHSSDLWLSMNWRLRSASTFHLARSAHTQYAAMAICTVKAAKRALTARMLVDAR
jgi:hypothetical protein